MESIKSKSRHKISYKHQTHKGIFIRFGLIVLIFLAYFLFVSTKYGYADGFFITWLSWSFLVLCTPIADAGILVDFPVRLVSGIRMIYSEVAVWGIAIILNIFAVIFSPEVYTQTQLLSLFKHIIDNPIPFWSIFIVSGVGTFLSIQVGDDLLDVIKHKHNKRAGVHDIKIKVASMVFVLFIAFALYDFLFQNFNLDMPI